MAGSSPTKPGPSPTTPTWSPSWRPSSWRSGRSPGSTVDSDALRGIASVLIHAGDEGPDSPLTAELGRLPVKARQGLRRAARSAARAGWDIAGAVTQAGYGYGELALSARAARALERQLGQALPQKTTATIYGRITGTKDIEGVLWFHTEGGVREFRATIDDEHLRRRAVEYQIDHPRVRAVFDVYESLPPGDDTGFPKRRTAEGEPATPMPLKKAE